MQPSHCSSVPDGHWAVLLGDRVALGQTKQMKGDEDTHPCALRPPTALIAQVASVSLTSLTICTQSLHSPLMPSASLMNTQFVFCFPGTI